MKATKKDCQEILKELNLPNNVVFDRDPYGKLRLTVFSNVPSGYAAGDPNLYIIYKWYTKEQIKQFILDWLK